MGNLVQDFVSLKYWYNVLQTMECCGFHHTPQVEANQMNNNISFHTMGLPHRINNPIPYGHSSYSISEVSFMEWLLVLLGGRGRTNSVLNSGQGGHIWVMPH